MSGSPYNLGAAPVSFRREGMAAVGQGKRWRYDGSGDLALAFVCLWRVSWAGFLRMSYFSDDVSFKGDGERGSFYLMDDVVYEYLFSQKL